MKDDKVRDEDGNELPPLGPDAAIHSKLQQELSSEIEKKPESEWGVTSSEGQQAAEVENKVDNANQGESNGEHVLFTLACRPRCLIIHLSRYSASRASWQWWTHGKG